MTEKITKDMLIGDAVEKYPNSARVMMENGLHCIGCHVSVSESIAEGARAHGLSDEQIDKMVTDMNKVAEKQPEPEKQ